MQVVSEEEAGVDPGIRGIEPLVALAAGEALQLDPGGDSLVEPEPMSGHY